jgi:hypothetical protein
MDNNLYVLNEIHKGLVMGMESINVIVEKVGDGNFKDDLDYQYNQYGSLLNKTNRIAQKEYDTTLDDTNPMQKIMGWSGIKMQTIVDKSNSHISEMLIQGNTMGIIEGRKLLNQNEDIDTNVKDLLNEFVTEQENSVEKLKTYL